MKSLNKEEYLQLAQRLVEKNRLYRGRYPNAAELFDYVQNFKWAGLLELLEKAQGREIILNYGTKNGRLVDHIVYYGFYDHETGEMEWINPPPDIEE